MTPTPGEAGIDVSVLVPVLDEEGRIRDTAEAMRRQTLGDRVELLFVDGGSRDRTRAILEEMAAEDPRVRVLDNPHRRVPQALNIALRHARGRYVARMDAHTFYPPEYLELGVARLERGDVDWVSGPQLPRGSDPGSRRIALALLSRLGTGGATFRNCGPGETEVDTGFTGVWRRETVERHGGWDEGWPVNQDSELAARVRAAGGRILCLPEMAADYVPRSTLKGLARQYARYGMYRCKTCSRHPESMRRSHLIPPLLVCDLALAVAAPVRPVRRAARTGLGAYGVAVLAASAALARRGRADALWLPAIFATMHVTWGAGFLAGCARFGVPVRAIARLLRP